MITAREIASDYYTLTADALLAALTYGWGCPEPTFFYLVRMALQDDFISETWVERVVALTQMDESFHEDGTTTLVYFIENDEDVAALRAEL